MVYIIVLIVVALAIALMIRNFFAVKKMPEGTEEMAEIAGIIRDGAKTFMKTEYKSIIIVVAVLALIFSLLVEKFAGITFLIGACMSSAACILGMRSATYANVRTTNKARETRNIGKTVKVALMGGSVSGLAVQAFGLFGLVIIMLIMGEISADSTSTGLIPLLNCNPSIMRLSTYSLGCSVVAMFNRVAGGNYTKAADISADIVAKIRHDMPEDDSRMPNTIADFIGDNVNDIAGNCSDLLESFVATVVASLLIATAINTGDAQLFKATCLFPVILAGCGLFGSIIGILFATVHKTGKDPSAELDLITYISAAVIFFGGGIAARALFGRIGLYESFRVGWASPWLSSLLGVISGVAIGKITEYYTSTKYTPVQALANISVEGEAFVVTKGDAIGSRSTLIPIAIIGLALFISGKISGVYGIAISALGMLSFVATTVTIDAFGPIADNAGGIAESCHLEHGVRTITDSLDAVGPILNIASFVVVAGAIIGGALVEYFSALLSDNTIESAHLMADEGDRQLSIPGVIEGKVRPDYEKCIRMAAEQALKKMLIPSILALVLPMIGGLIFGVEFVGGILIGATIVAIPRAIFMGNSGGAFDNAKKYVESGELKGHGKGSAAHKATVVGDTVGDTRKDVVGVALDIFIKTMSTVANTLAPIFSSFHLF